MLSHQTAVRVRYAETDQMGYVHHSHYAKYFEVARWELFREKLGISYKMVEEAGYLLTVISLASRFLKPAYYDDSLIINTEMKELKNVRMNFVYSITNSSGEIIHWAETTLAFTSKVNRKPCHPPAFILEAIEKYNSQQ